MKNWKESDREDEKIGEIKIGETVSHLEWKAFYHLNFFKS